MYYQSGIPSPARIYSFTLTNFVGGLNNREHIIDENQCSSVMNMAFTPDGVMQKRKGVTWFDDLDIGAPITFIDQYMPYQHEPVLIRASEEKMYLDGILIRDLGGQMHGTNFEGRYYFADTTGLFVYGKFEEPEGTYIKHEGTQITDYVLLEIVSPPEDFTPLGTTHNEGVRVINWDTRTIHYEPCENEMIDTFKGANVVPKNPRYIVAKEGRLYVAGSDDEDDTIYITDVTNPFYFPVTLSLQVTPNSDRITGLAVYNNSVIVGRRLDMYAIKGNTNRTDAGNLLYRMVKLNTHFGVANQRCMINAHNYLFFLGTDSQFYALRVVEDSTDVLQTQVLSKTVDIHGAPINVTKDDIWYSSACFYDDHYYVSIGDKVLVYNYMHQAWTVYDNIEATCFYQLVNILLIGTKNGKIVMQGTDYLDNGKPYEAHWTSRWFDMGDANSYKMFRDFFIITRSEKDISSTVNMLFEVDHFDKPSTVKLTTNYSVWGTSKYGEAYVSREINQSSPFMVFQRGRQIRVTFTNGSYIKTQVETFDDLATLEGIYDGMLVQVGEDTYYRLSNFEWIETNLNFYNENMCVLQLSGEYEFKWKR